MAGIAGILPSLGEAQDRWLAERRETPGLVIDCGNLPYFLL
jgi:hypothetical protein